MKTILRDSSDTNQRTRSGESRTVGIPRSAHLTQRQRDVLAAIRASINERGYPPTVRELRAQFGVALSTAHHDLVVLERAGAIRQAPGKARSIVLVGQPDPFPRVQGYCPSCGGESLFLALGGHVTCSRLDCPNPVRVSDWLAFKRRVVAGAPEVTR